MFYFNETYRHCQGRKRFSSTNNLLSVLLLLCGLYLFLPVNGMAAGYQEGLDSASKTLAAKISKAGKTNVAVVDFTDLQGSITELGRFVAEELSVNLAMAEKQFSVVDRIHLRNILAEQKLSISGLLNPKNAKKLGKIAGVDAIIIGSITPFGDNIRITFKVIATDTANIISAERISIAKTGAVVELLSKEISTPNYKTPSSSGGSGQKSLDTTYYHSKQETLKAERMIQNKFLRAYLVGISQNVENNRLAITIRIENITEQDLKLHLLGYYDSKHFAHAQALSNKGGRCRPLEKSVSGVYVGHRTYGNLENIDSDDWTTISPGSSAMVGLHMACVGDMEADHYSVSADFAASINEEKAIISIGFSNVSSE